VVYVKRNEQGIITALFNKSTEGASEELDFNHPDVHEFLSTCTTNIKWEYLESDLQMIRVIEDIVEILMQKSIIQITDFPPEAIDKLLARQKIRNQLSGSIGIIGDDDSE
jgi:hypothetical protein